MLKQTLYKICSLDNTEEVFFGYMKFVASSEKITGLHGREGLDFNQYILEYLVREFEDFPIKVKTIGAYTKEETEKAVVFLKNYPLNKALLQKIK